MLRKIYLEGARSGAARSGRFLTMQELRLDRLFSCTSSTLENDQRKSQLKMLSEALGESISENQDEIGQVHISTTKKNDSSMFGSKAQILPDFFDEVKDVAKRVETKATNAKNSRWSLEEKQRLMETVMKNRTSLRGTIDWEVVEREFPNRTRYACKAILKQMERSNETDSNMTNNKISFTKREKTLLTDAVRRLGDRNWAALAKEMSRDTGITRSPVVYNRMWTHKLSPKVQAAPLWSTNDTKRLRELSSIHGKDAVFLTFKFFPQYTPPLISTMLLRMGTKYEDRDPRRTVQLPKDRQRN